MVDVIIPVYNSRDTLSRCLDSIYRQKYLELIDIYIIDDCSTEKYDDIIENYGYAKIHYYRLNENSGSGISRETGINISKNDYIIFMDSDDYFLDDYSVKYLYSIINIYNLDYVSGLEYEEKTGKIFFSDSNLHSKIFRREFIVNNDIHFNNSRYHEDNLFISLVLASNPRRLFIKKLLYNYSLNKNSLTNNDNYNKFDKLEIFLNNFYYFLEDCKRRNCDRNIVLSVFANKVKFLRKIWRKFTDEEKEIFKKWLNKYNLDIIKYINSDCSNISLKEDIINNYNY